MQSVTYRSLRHWRYMVAEDYVQQTDFHLGVEKDYFSVSDSGVLTIRHGYCWDGPSGPVYQTTDALRAALVHDVFYQLIRMGYMRRGARKAVDDLFHRMLIEDGMGRFRAWYFWKAVRLFGGAAARKVEPYPRTLSAP